MPKIARKKYFLLFFMLYIKYSLACFKNRLPIDDPDGMQTRRGNADNDSRLLKQLVM